MEPDQNYWIMISAIATMIMALVVGMTIIFHTMQTKALKSQTLKKLM